MRIIVTGGAGFIGSHLLLHWAKQHPQDQLFNIDCLTYAANTKYISSLSNNPNYSFAKINLADRLPLREAIRAFKPEGVIHLAAESHVDNSIKDPQAFVQSNIVGTFNLLEECRQFWLAAGLKNTRFHHVSTDEVFGELGDTGAFTEDTPYAPNSPYSASKAASDHLVRAYNKTYGLNTVLTNCSNNFGPHQNDEKLIPTVIRTALKGLPIPVYGKGNNTRDWLFVEDHCRAIDLVFHKGDSGRNYNIGSNNEWKNLDLVKTICSLLNDLVGKGPKGDYAGLIKFVTDRPGHDFRYAIDASRIKNELGWQPNSDFTGNLRKTVQWYVEKYQ